MRRQRAAYPARQQPQQAAETATWPGVAMRLIDAVERGTWQALRVYGLVVVVGLVLVVATFAGVGAWWLIHLGR